MSIDWSLTDAPSANEESEETRKYAQKFFHLFDDDNFTAEVLSTISTTNLTEEYGNVLMKPEDIVGIFCQSLGAETFQLNCDIGIAVRTALGTLFNQGKILVCDEHKDSVTSLTKESYSKLIVENNGFIGKKIE